MRFRVYDFRRGDPVGRPELEHRHINKNRASTRGCPYGLNE